MKEVLWHKESWSSDGYTGENDYIQERKIALTREIMAMTLQQGFSTILVPHTHCKVSLILHTLFTKLTPQVQLEVHLKSEYLQIRNKIKLYTPLLSEYKYVSK